MQLHKSKAITYYGQGKGKKKPITQQEFCSFLETADEMVANFTTAGSLFHEEDMKRLALSLDEITGQSLKQRWAHS